MIIFLSIYPYDFTKISFLTDGVQIEFFRGETGWKQMTQIGSTDLFILCSNQINHYVWVKFRQGLSTCSTWWQEMTFQISSNGNCRKIIQSLKLGQIYGMTRSETLYP